MESMLCKCAGKGFEAKRQNVKSNVALHYSHKPCLYLVRSRVI